MCVRWPVLNGVVFPREGVVKMAASSQHVVTMPEGRNRLIQRSKNTGSCCLSAFACVSARHSHAC